MSTLRLENPVEIKFNESLNLTEYENDGYLLRGVDISKYKRSVKEFITNPDGEEISIPEVGEVVAGSRVVHVNHSNKSVLFCHEPVTASVYQYEYDNHCDECDGEGCDECDYNSDREIIGLGDSGDTFEQPPVYWHTSYDKGVRRYFLSSCQPFRIGGLIIPHTPSDGNVSNVCYGSYSNQLSSSVLENDTRFVMDIMHQFITNGTNRDDEYGCKWDNFPMYEWDEMGFSSKVDISILYGGGIASSSVVHLDAATHYPDQYKGLKAVGSIIDMVKIINKLEEFKNDK